MHWAVQWNKLIEPGVLKLCTSDKLLGDSVPVMEWHSIEGRVSIFFVVCAKETVITSDHLDIDSSSNVTFPLLLPCWSFFLLRSLSFFSSKRISVLPSTHGSHIYLFTFMFIRKVLLLYILFCSSHPQSPTEVYDCKYWIWVILILSLPPRY